jgi:hypothetical protein
VLGWRERVGEESGDKGTRERVEGGRQREREWEAEGTVGCGLWGGMN